MIFKDWEPYDGFETREQAEHAAKDLRAAMPNLSVRVKYSKSDGGDRTPWVIFVYGSENPCRNPIMERLKKYGPGAKRFLKKGARIAPHLVAAYTIPGYGVVAAKKAYDIYREENPPRIERKLTKKSIVKRLISKLAPFAKRFLTKSAQIAPHVIAAWAVPGYGGKAFEEAYAAYSGKPMARKIRAGGSVPEMAGGGQEEDEDTFTREQAEEYASEMAEEARQEGYEKALKDLQAKQKLRHTRKNPYIEREIKSGRFTRKVGSWEHTPDEIRGAFGRPVSKEEAYELRGGREGYAKHIGQQYGRIMARMPRTGAIAPAPASRGGFTAEQTAADLRELYGQMPLSIMRTMERIGHSQEVSPAQRAAAKAWLKKEIRKHNPPRPGHLQKDLKIFYQMKRMLATLIRRDKKELKGERKAKRKTAAPAQRKQIAPAKARQILHEGEAHGRPLTDKQRRYFAWRASQKNPKGRYPVYIGEYTDVETGKRYHVDMYKKGYRVTDYKGRRVDLKKLDDPELESWAEEAVERARAEIKYPMGKSNPILLSAVNDESGRSTIVQVPTIDRGKFSHTHLRPNPLTRNESAYLLKQSRRYARDTKRKNYSKEKRIKALGISMGVAGSVGYAGRRNAKALAHKILSKVQRGKLAMSTNPPPGYRGPVRIYGKTDSITMQKTEGPYKGKYFEHKFTSRPEQIGIPRGTKVIFPDGKSYKMTTRSVMLTGKHDLYRNFRA